jgi:hypothetical protein
MFWKIIVPSFSGLGSSKRFFLGLLDPEGQAITILQNFGKCLPSDVASHPRGLGITM